MISEEEIRQGWITWIQNECNNKFLDDGGELDLPPDIEFILLPYLMKTHTQDPNVSNERVADLSRSFHSSGLPERVKRILDKYRRLSWA